MCNWFQNPVNIVDYIGMKEGGGERERERRKYNRKVEEKYRDTRIPKN